VNDGRRRVQEQVADLDGGIAELVKDGAVSGWVAVRVAPFRNIFMIKQIGCWLLFTWSDGSIHLEEDYPPFVVTSELLAGTFRDEGGGAEYEVRWADDHRRELWDSYGIHEAPGYYAHLAARQSGDLR